MNNLTNVWSNVHKEREELMEKLIKLDTKLITEDVQDVSPEQLELLQEQRGNMNALYGTLTKRMNGLKKEIDEENALTIKSTN